MTNLNRSALTARLLGIVVLSLAATGLLFGVAPGSSSGSGSGSGSSGNSSSSSSSSSSKSSNLANPKTAEEWYDLGKASADAGYYADAISQLSTAIRMKADYAEAYNMLGFSYRKSGQLAKAFPAYETALRLRPDFEEAHEYYGEAFLQAGNLTRAMKEYIYLKNRDSPAAAELWEGIEEYVAKVAR